MAEPVQRVKRALPVSAEIRGRTRSVEGEGERDFTLRRIERVRGGFEACVRHTASLQLDEERLEPVGMFVVDRDGMHVVGPGQGRWIDPSLGSTWTVTLLAVIAKTKAPRSWWDRSAGRSGCYVLHANAQTTTCRGTHGAHGGTHGGLGERHGEQGKSAWNEHQGGLCNLCVVAGRYGMAGPS